MSKSCWQPSHFHMAVCPPRTARLWRMVAHAWAVIISHASVSSGSPDLPCCSVMPRCWVLVFSDAGAPSEAASLLSISSASPERIGNQTGTHSLSRNSTAQLRTAQCIGTRSHSDSHTHTLTHTPSLSVSLTLTAATAIDADAAAGAPAELFPALLTLGFRGNSFLCALSFA